MNGIRYGQNLQVVPLLNAASISTASKSAFVKTNNALWVNFLATWGAIDSAITFLVESCTSNSTSGATLVGMAASYRLQAHGSDTWGEITAMASTGLALESTTYNNYAMVIDFDPRTLADGYNYVRLKLSCTASTISHSVWGIIEPRYAQNFVPSSS